MLRTFSLTEKIIFFISCFFIILGVIGISIDQIRSFYNIKPHGGTFTEYIDSSLRSLNPFFVLPNSPEEEINSLLFSSLVKYDPHSGNFVGDLAETFDISEDFTTYHFIIRSDQKWHNGKEVSLADVEFTYNLLKEEQINSPYYAVFKYVTFETNTEENSLSFHIQEPDSLFLQTFTFPIVPKHLLEKISYQEIKDSFLNNNPIGSGKYQLREIVHINNSSIVKLDFVGSEKNAVNVSSLQFLFSEELKEKNISSLSAFRNKPDHVPENFTIHEIPVPQYKMLFFNSEKDFLHPDLKKALLYTWGLLQQERDKKTLDNVFLSRPEDTPPFWEEHTAEETETKIRELFYNAGWKMYTKEFDDDMRRNEGRSKLVINLYTLSETEFEEIAEIFQKKMKSFGVTINILSYSWKDLFANVIQEKSFDLLLLNMEMGYGDDWYKFLHSSQKEDLSTGRNYSFFSDYEIDLLLEDLKMAKTTERKNAVLFELEKRYDSTLPFILIEKDTYEYCVRDTIKGLSSLEHALSKKDRLVNLETLFFEK